MRDALNQAVNKRTVNEITSRQRDQAMNEIRIAVQESVKGLGVEIVDVRLKRIDFVPEISDSVYGRMQAERKRVANEQRSIGSAEGEKIRADADRQREVLLAEAYSAAQKVKGEGDAKASATYAQAFGQNPRFRRVLSHARGVSNDLQESERPDGDRSVVRILQVPEGLEAGQLGRLPGRARPVSSWSMSVLGLAVALMLVFEGLMPLVAPKAWRQMFAALE